MYWTQIGSMLWLCHLRHVAIYALSHNRLLSFATDTQIANSIVVPFQLTCHQIARRSQCMHRSSRFHFNFPVIRFSVLVKLVDSSIMGHNTRSLSHTHNHTTTESCTQSNDRNPCRLHRSSWLAVCSAPLKKKKCCQFWIDERRTIYLFVFYMKPATPKLAAVIN